MLPLVRCKFLLLEFAPSGGHLYTSSRDTDARTICLSRSGVRSTGAAQSRTELSLVAANCTAYGLDHSVCVGWETRPGQDFRVQVPPARVGGSAVLYYIYNSYEQPTCRYPRVPAQCLGGRTTCYYPRVTHGLNRRAHALTQHSDTTGGSFLEPSSTGTCERVRPFNKARPCRPSEAPCAPLEARAARRRLHNVRKPCRDLLSMNHPR